MKLEKYRRQSQSAQSPVLIMGSTQGVVTVWDMKADRVTEGLTLHEESGLCVVCITYAERRGAGSCGGMLF